MEFTVSNVFIYGSIIIFSIGVFGVLINKNLVKIALAIGIMELGVNLFLVALSYFSGSIIPIITKFTPEIINKMADPLPHALVLTSIVIGLGTTALSLVLIDNYYKKRKTLIIENFTETGDEE